MNALLLMGWCTQCRRFVRATQEGRAMRHKVFVERVAQPCEGVGSVVDVAQWLRQEASELQRKLDGVPAAKEAAKVAYDRLVAQIDVDKTTTEKELARVKRALDSRAKRRATLASEVKP